MIPARTKRRWRRAAILLALAFAAVMALPFAVDAAVRPWSLSLVGGATLTGTWQGTVTLAPDDTRQVSLRLSRDHFRSVRNRCRHCADIEGAAAVCDAHGHVLRYDVSGDPRDWSGHEFWLNLSADQLAPGTHRLFRRVDGRWNGEDTLRLRATPETVHVDETGAVRGTAGTASPARETRFELTRAGGALRCPLPE